MSAIQHVLRTADAVAKACERKAPYGSEQSARQHGQIFIRENGNVDRLYPYPCANCRHWHLTKEVLNTPAITGRAIREGVA